MNDRDFDENGKFKQGNKAGKGRPKGSLSINNSLRKLLEKYDKESKKYMYDAVAQRMLAEGLKGDKEFNAQLLIHIHKMLEGNPPQAVNLGGQEENPLSVIVISPAGQKTEIDDDPE